MRQADAKDEVTGREIDEWMKTATEKDIEARLETGEGSRAQEREQQ